MAIPVDGIGVPLAHVQRTIRPGVDTIALLLSPIELPIVARAALPLLHADAVLDILHPLAPVSGEAMLVHIKT